MNILVLNYEFPPIGGGASPVAYDISKLLVAAGNDVVVVTMQYKDLATYEIIDGIKIYRVPCLRKKGNVCHPWEQLSYIISACIFLKRHLKTNKYDICHTHFIIPTGVIALYLKKKFALNYVLTAHGSDVIGHNNSRFKLLYLILRKPWEAIVRNARCVTAPATHLKKKMNSVCSSANYRIIPNGVFLDDYKILEKEKYILIMSRIQESKGIQTIIQAFSKIEKNDWKLKIAGDGPYRPILEKLVKQLGINNSVEFLGWVKGKSNEHINLLGKATIFISASWFEAHPVSLLEAMASGCYILVSDIPAHRELLNSKNIFGNDELEKYLQIAFSKPIQATQYDITKYDWINIIKNYEKILSN